MEHKPYSFNTKLQTISKLIIFCMVIFSILGAFLIVGTYDLYVQSWITNNTTSTTPINPINPSNPSSTNIPYLSIFSTNVLQILIGPLTFIFISNVLFIQTKRYMIKKEINNLFQSLGLHQNGSLTALINLDSENKLFVQANYKGYFTLIKDNTSLSYVSGDELLWKIRYLTFKETKN